MVDRLSTFDRQTLNVNPEKVKCTLTNNQCNKKIKYITPIFLSKQPQSVCDAKKNNKKTTKTLRSKIGYLI